MSTDSILISYPAPRIVRITLNRPKALNAINVDLLDNLTSALRQHSNASVLILEGSGDRSFCAGEDLKQTLAPRTGSAEELREAFVKLQEVTRLTSCASCVVVAAVQGFAIGGGAEIALAADFVIGGLNAKFKFPEASIGHAVTGGISLRLIPMVGLLKAKQLLMLGQFTDAKEALRIGLLIELVEDPKSRALELAIQLAGMPRIAVMSSKTSVERAAFPNMENVLHDEVNVASYCFAQGDAVKAFSDFSERKEKNNELTPRTRGISNLPRPIQAHKDSKAIKDINSALETAVRLIPDRTFLRFGGSDFTFKEFDASVGALAAGLKDRGIESGDRVLVMMRNSVEMVHLWMASNRLGAIWVPVNVELKSITLKHVVRAADPKIAIVDDEFYSEIMSTGALNDRDIYSRNKNGPNSLTRLYNTSNPLETPAAVTPATPAAFLYTSGTTGLSKPCILSHQYFILQANSLMESFGLHQDDVLYCPFPLFHADATALTVIPAILLGATAALSVRFSASKFWTEMRETKATVYDFMGATLALAYKQPPSPRDRDHKVRLAWGVPVPAFAKDYQERFGHPLFTLYGSVEASIPIIQKGALVPGSCGTVSPGYQLRIVDEDDEPVPAGTTGQMLLRSDFPNAFFQGYINNPEATASANSSLWFHTGDLGKVDDAENVFFVGRIKDVIRRRGENINAAEVEEEFLAHPDVMVAAAFAIPSSLGSGTEDEIKVAIQLRAGADVDELVLWTWASEHMARFQVPSVIEIVDEIRKTPTGKIEKSSLSAEGGKRF